MYSNVTCKFYIMSPCSAIISIKKNIITAHCDGSCLSVWVCSQHTRMAGGEREKGLQFLMAASLCRKFPLISSSPRPHILPPLFPCFPSNSGDSGNPPEHGRAFLPVLPRGCWPLVRSAARSLTVLCAVPVVKRGVGLAGLAPWEALGRKETKASFGKRSVVAAMNPWVWIELSCDVGWRLRGAQRTAGLQNQLRRL